MATQENDTQNYGEAVENIADRLAALTLFLRLNTADENIILHEKEIMGLHLAFLELEDELRGLSDKIAE